MDDMQMTMSCPMNMQFHWSNNECITFKQWHVTNEIQLWVSGIAIIGVCLFRELILYTSKYIQLCKQYHGEIPFCFHTNRVAFTKSISSKDSSSDLTKPPAGVEAVNIIQLANKKSDISNINNSEKHDINNSNNSRLNDDDHDESRFMTNKSNNNRKHKQQTQQRTQEMEDNHDEKEKSIPVGNRVASKVASVKTNMEQRTVRFKRYLMRRASRNGNKVKYGHVNSNSDDQDNFQCLQNKRIFVMFDSVLFAINISIGYWLMLVVMTYNGLLCICVVAGFVIARLIFLSKTEELQQYVLNHRIDTGNFNIDRDCDDSLSEDDIIHFGDLQQTQDHCNLGA